jgi:hypothetical protein
MPTLKPTTSSAPFPTQQSSTFTEIVNTRPVTDADIEPLLDLMRFVHERLGKEVPPDEELRQMLPKTIVVSELKDIRTALQRASSPE